jgi:hypothetical protein
MLDLDHVRAEVREQRRDHGAREQHPGVDDPEPGERACCRR